VPTGLAAGIGKNLFNKKKGHGSAAGSAPLLHRMMKKALPSPLGWVDYGLLLMVAAGVYLLTRSMESFAYDWNWSVIPQYLWLPGSEGGSGQPGLLLRGLFTTIKLSLWTMLFATITGLVAGLMRCSKHLFLRLGGSSFVLLIRNIPPLVLIFIFYYFVSDLFLPQLGIDQFMRSTPETFRHLATVLFAPAEQINAFIAAVIVLTILEGSYITEIVRSGILSVSRDQWESSAALGMKRSQQLRYIILPQALPRMLPPLAGQFISTIKDSAIVSVISIQELTFQGMELMAATYLTLEIWITVTVLYLIMTLSCSRLTAIMESRIRERWQF